MGVRDSRCDPKSYVIGVGIDSGIVAHWHLHWVLVSRQGLGICASLVLPVTVVTLFIGMCKGVDE